jgi:hypothetical protein
MPHLVSRQHVVDVFWGSRPDEHGGYCRMGHGPRHGQSNNGDADLGGLFPKQVKHPGVAVGQVLVGVPRCDGESRVEEDLRSIWGVLAGEETGADGAISTDGHTFPLTQGKHLRFHLSNKEVVTYLNYLVKPEPSRLAGVQTLLELDCGLVPVAWLPLVRTAPENEMTLEFDSHER